MAGSYRFSAASVRRAFDAGWSAAEVHAWLDGTPAPACRSRWPTWSTTSARRHGTIRVGSGRVLPPGRGRDPGRRAAGPSGTPALGLRRVAPGVLVADGRRRPRWWRCCASSATPRRSRTPAASWSPRRPAAGGAASAATCVPVERARRGGRRRPADGRAEHPARREPRVSDRHAPTDALQQLRTATRRPARSGSSTSPPTAARPSASWPAGPRRRGASAPSTVRMPRWSQFRWRASHRSSRRASSH